jgi:glycosyltransferase involved in cell wall biosynthesis
MSRIVLVLGDGSLTGAPMHVLQLAKALKKQKLSVLVICPHGPIVKKFEVEQIPVEVVSMRGVFDKSSMGRISEIIKKFDPDIAHFHGTRAGWLGILAIRDMKHVRKIYTEHLWTNNYHFSNAAYEQFQLAGLKFVVRYCNKVIAVSKSVQEFLLKRGYRREKVVLIHNGIPDKFLDLNPIKKPKEMPLVIGSVGSLNQIKNYENMIRAFALVKKDKPDLNVHYQIIGEGPLRGKLEGMVRSFKIEDVVHFMGRLEDIGERLQHFSVFMSCSNSESFGMAVGEAMAVGLPVIASDIETLKNLTGDCAILVDPTKPVEIKNTVLKLIEDEKLREKLASCAKERIRENFTESSMTEKTIDLYEKILKG